MSGPDSASRRALLGALALSSGLAACGSPTMPSSPTATPVPEPPLPSRTPAPCSPAPHRFSGEQPLRHGDTGHGIVDGRIRYLLPLALSPDGRELAGSYRDAVVVWEAATGKVARVLATASWTDVLAWSPDGVELTTEDADGVARLDAACGSSLGELRGHRRVLSEAGAASRVTGAVFSPDGRRLLTTGADGTLRSWAVADGSPLTKVELDAPRHPAVSPDGATVVVTTGDGTASLHSVRDLSRTTLLEPVSSRWRFLDDATLLGGTDDGKVLGVTVADGSERELFAVPGRVRDVAVSPDGAVAVAQTEDEGAWLARIDGPARPVLLPRLEWFGGAIGGACFSPDGATVYACDQFTGIAAYDLAGALLHRFEAPSG